MYNPHIRQGKHEYYSPKANLRKVPNTLDPLSYIPHKWDRPSQHGYPLPLGYFSTTNSRETNNPCEKDPSSCHGPINRGGF